MRRPSRHRSRLIHRACLAVPGLLLCRSALAQTYDPDVSDIRLVATPGVGAADSAANSPFTTIDVPGATTALPTGFAPYATPAGDSLSPHDIYAGTPPANIFQLSSTATNTPPNGPTQSIAYASVGEAGGNGGNTDVVLGAGSGVTQTNPGGAYPYASQLSYDVNHLTYSVSKIPTIGGFPTINYAFPVAGILPVGGTVDFDVSLSYYYYNTTATTTQFTFSSTQTNTAINLSTHGTLTALKLGTINIAETFTNTLATQQSFSTSNAGALLLNNGLPITTGGFLDVVGTVSFQAIVDSPGGQSQTIQNTSAGGSWTGAVSPTSFELYLSAPATIAPAGGAGNTFVETSGVSLSNAASWTDITSAVAGPPGANDIAMFNSSSTGNAGAFTLPTATTWGGISVVGTGAAVNLNAAAESTVSLGAYGITVGQDTLGLSRSLTFNTSILTTASQTWSVTGGQTLTVSGGQTVALGANTLTIAGAGNVSLPASVSGIGGSIVMNGTGLLNLAGFSLYTGGTVLNSGEVAISNDDNIGGPSSAITFNGGILQVNGATLSSLGSHVVNYSSFSGGFDITNPSTTFSVNTPIGNAALNSGSLTKLGAGTLQLANGNTYAGPTTISGGALLINSNTVLNPLSTISVNTPMGLALNNSPTLANPITVNTAAGEFLQVDGFQQVDALTGAVTAASGAAYNLGITGLTNTLTLTGANTVPAGQPAAISEGNITFSGNGSLTAAPTGALVLGATANPLNLTLMGNSSITNRAASGINIGGGGPVTSATVSLQGNAILNAGTGNIELLQTTAGNAVSTLNLNGGTVLAGGFTLTPAAGAASTATAIINFNGGVVAATANNANFFPSGTAGSLQLNVGANGAIIDTNGFNITLNSPRGFTSAASGGAADGGLIKNGSGALQFGSNFGATNGFSGYTGPTLVNGGLLETSVVDQLFDSNGLQVNAGGAAGTDDGSTSEFFYSLLTTNEGLAPPQMGGLALAPVDSNRNIDYTGQVSGAFQMAGITLMSIGAVSAGVMYTGTITPPQVGDAGVPTYQLGGGGLLILPTTSAGSAPLVDQSGQRSTVVIENGGTVWLQTTNTYSGPTSILGIIIPDNPISGATQLEQTTLQVSNLANGTNSLGSANHGVASELLINGGVLRYVGPTVSNTLSFLVGTLGATIDSSGTGPMTIVAASPGFANVTGTTVLTLTGSEAGNTFGSPLVNSGTATLGLTKSGTGSWLLTGNNNYTGPTTVSQGLLQLGVASALGGTSSLTVNGGGTLDLHGFNFTVPSLSGGGGVVENLATTGTATLIVNTTQSTTFSGNLINGGAAALALNKQGSGTLMLTGTNTNTGATTIVGGEVSISSDQNIGSTINFNGGTLQVTGTTLNNLNNHTVNFATFNGGLDIASPGNIFTISNAITGPGTLTKLGLGTLALTGSNTYSGGTIIDAGAVLVPSLTFLGSGPIVNNGAIEFLNGASGTLSTSLTGSGGLNVSGAATLTGSNSFTGVTSVNFGATLTLANNSALPAAAQVQNYGSLIVGAQTTLGGVQGDGTTTVNAGDSLNAMGFVQSGLVNNGAATIACGGTVGMITGSGGLTVGSTSMSSNLQIAQSTSGTASTQGHISVFIGSVLDITNNKIVVNYSQPGSDPISPIAVDLASGYNAGTWTGTGITSSLAAANPGKFAVGYLDGNRAADAGNGTVAANQIVIKYTLAGDAFLQNSVGFDDLVVVAENFGATGKDWAGGNFNYSSTGSVGFADLVSVAENFGATTGLTDGLGGGGLSPAWSADISQINSTAVVPEPICLGPIAFAIFGCILASRRRGRVTN